MVDGGWWMVKPGCFCLLQPPFTSHHPPLPQPRGHTAMIIFDAHLDLAWNAIDWNRDLRLPVEQIRRAEQGMTDKGRGCNTVSFPDLRRGKVAVFISTLLPRL